MFIFVLPVKHLKIQFFIFICYRKTFSILILLCATALQVSGNWCFLRFKHGPVNILQTEDAQLLCFHYRWFLFYLGATPGGVKVYFYLCAQESQMKKLGRQNVWLYLNQLCGNRYTSYSIIYLPHAFKSFFILAFKTSELNIKGIQLHVSLKLF